MSYPRLASRLYNVPLLITPAKAEVIERVFRTHVEGTTTALPALKGEPRQKTDLALPGGAAQTKAGYFRTGDGIAVIQVVGSLVQRGSGMDAMSGLESYDNIGAQLNAAMTDPLVRGILLEIDSGGGEGAGLFDLAAQVRAADAIKPVTAHANEQAFSAAYALGASAGEFYVAQTGMVGSVGVIMLHVDQSTYDAKRGMAYTPIFAGAKKADFSSHAPLSDAAAADAQAMVDRLYQTFVAHVADMRGIDAQSVRDTEAGMLHPDQALELGMVDGTATFSKAVENLRARLDDRLTFRSVSQVHNRAAQAGAQPQENSTMATDPKTPAATAAVPQEQLDAARAAGAAEANAAATKQAADAGSAGARAERERVAGILGHAEAGGRRKLAEHLAFKTTQSVDDAVALLTSAPKEAAAAGSANLLAAAMGKVTNPNVGADANGDSDASKVVPPSAANIYAFRRDCVAKARAAGK